MINQQFSPAAMKKISRLRATFHPKWHPLINAEWNNATRIINALEAVGLNPDVPHFFLAMINNAYIPGFNAHVKVLSAYGWTQQWVPPLQSYQQPQNF